MAEITQGSSKETGHGKIRAKKLSTRIDMTPMVDLAFLLLTFFILTSSLNKSQIMLLTMPERTEDPSPVNEKNILNLVLAGNNKVYWWKGLEPIAEVTDYSNGGIRQLLLESVNTNPKLMVLIKPQDNARYQNIIDILDEIVITKIPNYAIVDFTDDDKIRIAKQ